MRLTCSDKTRLLSVLVTLLSAILVAACAPSTGPAAHTPMQVSPASGASNGTPVNPTATAGFTFDLSTPIALTVTANRGRLPGVGEMRTVLPRDTIRAVLEPRFLAVDDADGVYGQNEPVIGIEIDGFARAYSIPFLSEHEIVNDEIAGRKIAVTW